MRSDQRGFQSDRVWIHWTPIKEASSGGVVMNDLQSLENNANADIEPLCILQCTLTAI